jgi:hypothetical protein
MMFVPWMRSSWLSQAHKSHQVFHISHLSLNVRAQQADHVLAAEIVAVVAVAVTVVAIVAVVAN